MDNHVREAAAYNLFNEVKPLVPCQPSLGMLPYLPAPLNTGATLRGDLGYGSADLILDATTTDSLVSFELHFTT